MPDPTNPDSKRSLSYVLITPARNEEAYIEKTIKSVVDQTFKPLRWVIVSDGSTDHTYDIVAGYVKAYPWIQLTRTPERLERHFAGKVHAFNTGYELLKDLSYDIIGNLDADISFDPDYFSFLLAKFSENPKLGVGGTPFREGVDQYDYRFASIEHVSGACQLFRRECFEAIGGYTPLKMGGIDLKAVMTARMLGWQTRSFPEKTCQHSKKTQTGNHSRLNKTWKSGYHDYLMGSHFLFQIMRAGYHMTKPPFFLGGLSLLSGYFWAWMTRPDKYVSKELEAFRNKEQLIRIRNLLNIG